MTVFILSFITQVGYPAVLALMFLENIFPPIPSEIILPFVGYAVAQGNLNFTLALLVATAGSLLGTTAWYFVGRLVPISRLESFFLRYGGYIAIELRDFQMVMRFFQKYKMPVVLFGRLLPGIRSGISIPAGCVQMPIHSFLALSALGTLLWNTALMLAGYVVLGNFASVSQYLNPVADGIIYGLIILYLLQVVRFTVRRWRQGDFSEKG